MGIAVFDADVLIAYRSRDDAQHREAVARMRRAHEGAFERRLCSVSYAELLVGPLRTGGPAAADRTTALLTQLGFEIVPDGAALARAAAEVRAETNLKLPDAYVVATALAGAAHDDVRLESFDRDVLRAYESLTTHP